MATSEGAPEPGGRLALGSYETAVCVIPPAHHCQDIDHLRALYDKAYEKWPAHINLIYPFVAVESLPRAVDMIQSTLARVRAESEKSDLRLRLNKADYFSHRHSNTIYITDSDGTGTQNLKTLRLAILENFKHADDMYNPHLTIGQRGAQDTWSPEYLLGKASLLPSIEWEVQELVVLVRERLQEQDRASSQMTVWGTIELSGNAVSRVGKSPKAHKKPQTEEEWSDKEEKMTASGCDSSAKLFPIRTDHAGARSSSNTYQFSTDAALWEPFRPWSQLPAKGMVPSCLKISSYNVLVNSFYPPTRDRYALLLHAVFSEPALADILVLQEVSDDFLSHFLGQDNVRSLYPFTTHGPPDQQGIGPLTSLRNIVVLSRWSFSWEWVPFTRRHKGAVILKFDTIGTAKDSNFLPLIVAGVHLTCGLTDGSVAAKKSQLQTVVNHLSSNYPGNPWIVAGDFNITTSAFTIDEALKNKSISSHTASAISSLETLLSEARLSDSWFVARAESSDTPRLAQGQLNIDDLYEGEQGATFDPIQNPVAAKTAGGGSYSRPQRYDRILVKGASLLNVTGFNIFGFPEDASNEAIQDRDAELCCASDHWGVRASMRIDPDAETENLDNGDFSQVTPLLVKKAPTSLSDVSALKSYLAEQSIFPRDEEIDKRKEVFALIKDILQQTPTGNDRSTFSMVVVATGSYALGVWDKSSDIDCLCVGSISARTFFELAGQRLRKAADLGVRILRKVKANSGTMVELDVRGVKMDLQYCPATKIAERWPEVIQLPPSDPSFDLPIQSLTKLKSFRDLEYLQRTIPDLLTFRTAHRFIRTWAKQRGIYAAKFGYLGGIHITLLLSRICKLLFRDAGAITAADIICIFFHHYATFDFKNQMVFDPFFEKQQPKYRRSTREPMVILGFHAPRTNVSHTASVPSVETIVQELKRADELISEARITWPDLLSSGDTQSEMIGLPTAASEFLTAYSSYIKIDVQYWGLSLAKGSTLVGWLESRCVQLLVDITRKLPEIHSRIWPTRYTQSNPADNDQEQDERDYQGSYLIGLSKRKNINVADKNPARASTPTESDRKLSQNALQATLDRFLDKIRGDEKYYDATSSWVNLSHIRQSDVGDLKQDDREWGHYITPNDDHSDSEDEDEDEISPLDGESNEEAARPPTKPKSRPTPNPASTRKLRPATDILNRLRWDPALDASEYIVGYEDRFLGTREMPLGRWKSEATDEEFIPQHRILYFKKRGVGEGKGDMVIWDRVGRVDRVFGSGVGAGMEEGESMDAGRLD